MAKATVTIREVKNKVTGLDLSIPSHAVIPGLLSSTIDYHVVVVTNLAVFKSPKHKETDTVQFMITKRIADFEDLKWDLEGKFRGLTLPHLPKRDLIGDSSVQGKLTLLERFLSVIALTGKLATHHVTLQFLGVNPYKAGKFRAEEGAIDKPTAEVDTRYDIFEDANDSSQRVERDSPEDLFGEATDTTDHLFEAAVRENQDAAQQRDEQEPDLFSDTRPKPADAARLFEAPDLGGAIRDEEEALFLVPGSRADRSETALRERLDQEDNTDLLNIEDDLDKLLKVGAEKKQEAKPVKPAKPTIKPKPSELPPKPGVKPKPGAKPNIAPKPTVPSKPKPVIASKPVKPKPKLLEDENEDKLFTDEAEPDIFGKTAQIKKDTSDVDLFSLTTDVATGAEDIDADDILKYIQTNAENKDEDLNLFS